MLKKPPEKSKLKLYLICPACGKPRIFGKHTGCSKIVHLKDVKAHSETKQN